jgi:hypothetical protein
MADTLKARGHQVAKAAIEFTDHRYSQRFSHWPMRYPIWKIVGMLPAQLRRKTGSVSIPAARDGDYDLIVIGSPTWWLTTNMPIRSYLKDPAARNVLRGKPFAAFTVWPICLTHRQGTIAPHAGDDSIPGWHENPGRHPSRSPSSRDWATAWLRVEAPSLR